MTAPRLLHQAAGGGAVFTLLLMMPISVCAQTRGVVGLQAYYGTLSDSGAQARAEAQFNESNIATVLIRDYVFSDEILGTPFDFPVPAFPLSGFFTHASSAGTLTMDLSLNGPFTIDNLTIDSIRLRTVDTPLQVTDDAFIVYGDMTFSVTFMAVGRGVQTVEHPVFFHVTDTAASDEICSNGVDDDGDGFTDCEDNDCAADPNCGESNCSNGLDDDQDGFIDCEDADCASDQACTENDCSNGIDDDGDGFVDCNDSDCASDPLCGSTPSPTPTPIPADNYDVTFTGNQEGWGGVGLPGIFDEPTFQTVDDAIRISPNGSTNCFGFWQSPALTIDPDSLYAISWTLRSDVTPDQVPEIRLRVAEGQNRHAALEVISSAGDGQFSPGSTPALFNQSYLSGSFESQITLNLDILSFDPSNNASASVDLLSVNIVKIE